MANINMSSIMSKVSKYATSKDGKKRINDILKKHREEGRVKTEGGSEILTKARMAQLAQELIDILKTTAQSYDLPDSVMAHFDSLTAMFEDTGDNRFTCYIYFADKNISRPSLENDYKQWGGINNIVALFNNGYVASAPKYGWWKGHKPSGESVYRSGVESANAYIQGTQARPSLRFMQSAIEDFYSKYAKRYAMTVVLNDDYDGNYAGSLNGVISKI